MTNLPTDEIQAAPKTPQEFVEAFEKLSKSFGYTIQPQLGFKQQIDGTFTIAVNLTIVPRKDTP